MWAFNPGAESVHVHAFDDAGRETYQIWLLNMIPEIRNHSCSRKVGQTAGRRPCIGRLSSRQHITDRIESPPSGLVRHQMREDGLFPSGISRRTLGKHSECRSCMTEEEQGLTVLIPEREPWDCAITLSSHHSEYSLSGPAFRGRRTANLLQ